MNDKAEFEDRLTQIEARISYQDDVIEKLNLTIIEQWKQIELQGRQIAQFHDRLQEAERGLGENVNEPPPHY